MQSALNLLAGKKTYLTLLISGVLLLGSWRHWWSLSPEVITGLQLAALGFIKAGLARDLKNKGETNEQLNQTAGEVAASCATVPLAATPPPTTQSQTPK